MSKRVLSLFMALVLCFSMLPAAVLAEKAGAAQGAAEQSVTGTPVAKVGDTEYETLGEILEDMSEVTITLLDNVSEKELTVYAATTIIMNGHSITGNIDAEDSLTLTGGIVDGTVTMDGGVLNMTAPSDAKAAITKGLIVTSGSAYVSGAQIGVKTSLSFGGNELTISGSDRAVSLVGDPIIGGNATIYGATEVDGDAAFSAEYDDSIGTYTINGTILKKISTKQGGGTTPEPTPVTLEMAPESATVNAGETAEFTVTYDGTDALKAYVQKNGQDDTIDAAYDADTGKVIVATTEEASGKYTIYVHEINNNLIQAKASLTIKPLVANDSVGNNYFDIESAIQNAPDDSTVTVVAVEKRLPVPDGVYVKAKDKGITLDLNGHSLDGYSINVGGYQKTGKLTVIDRSAGSGAVGLAVRDGGEMVFAPENVNTTLLQLEVYGGKIELRGGSIKAGKWTFGSSTNLKLADLLPSAGGYAYRLYYRGNAYGDWVKLADAQSNTASTQLDLAVVKCEHTDIDTDNNCCLYCGQEMAARNGIKYYPTVEAALNEANANDTITLLKTINESISIRKNITINLNNYESESNITIYSGSTLKLDGTGTVKIVQTGFTDLLTGQTAEDLIGGALDVLSNDVIVGKLVVQQSPTPPMNLSKGTFWKIELSDNLEGSMTANQLLAEGYAFASNGSGNVENGYVYRLDNVKVVAHEQHDTSSGPCDCGYTCDHVNGFTDEGKCPDCGLQCPASVVDKTGAVLQYYASLQAAINAHNALANDMVMLLTDTNGSYTVDERQLRINLNGHTVQSLLITGSGSLALQGLEGKIQNLTFNGTEAKSVSATWPVLGQITISGGASWSSILPDSNSYEEWGNYYGYQVYSDNGTYKWYDRNTAEACAEENGTVIKNVRIQSLPIRGKYTLMVNGKAVVQRHAVSNKAQLKYIVKADTSDAECTFWWKTGSGNEWSQLLEDYSNGCYDSDQWGGLKLGAAGTYKVWAVLKKDGYECKTEVFDIISKPDLGDAEIKLKQSEFTYTPLSDGDAEEFKPEIESVTLDGKTLDASEYDIGGEIAGTDARNYTLTITAKEGSDYIGSATVNWTINPCVLTDVEASMYRSYDGTTEVTADSIVKNDPPHFFYNYCPEGGITLKYGEDYDYMISDVDAKFWGSDVGEHGEVSFVVELKNSNYIFKGENNNYVNFKTVNQDMYIVQADLPAGCEPDAGSLVVRNGVAHNYRFNVSALRKDLPSPQRYGNITYSVEESGTLNADYYTDKTASIDKDGILTLPIKEVKTTKEGSIGTVKVRVCTQNYNDFYVTVNVTTANRIVPTGEPKLSRDAITYGEPISSITLSGTMHDDTNYVDVEGTFAWNGDPKYVLPVGTVRVGWTFTPDDAVTYASAQGTSVFTVNKAAMPEDAITAAPEAISYLIYQPDVSTPQVLHTKGEVRDNLGKMMYTLGDPESADTVWSEEPVASRNAGEYTVYYKVFGDDNHLDSAYGEIKCSIAKYKLTYSVVCLPKVYDGTTVGDPKRVDSVKFYSDDISSKEITGFVNGTDYTVDKIEYKSANVGGNLGTLPVDATATLSLIGDTAVNYTLADNGKASGLITPAPFTGIDFNSYTHEICYGETSARSVYPSSFGAPDGQDYEIYSDMNVISNEVLSKFEITSDSFFTFKVKEGLKDDAVGKSVTVTFNIYSKDHNYRSEDLTFTVKIIDKATPRLTVKEIETVYNNKPVPASLIVGTATIDGHEISGTWSWENGAPTEVKDSGEYTVLFTPTYSYLYYGATEKAMVTVTPRDIGDKDITFSYGDSFVYTGKFTVPYIYGEYKYDENIDALELVEDKAYTLTYPEDVTNVGKKTITVTGRGNFGGTTELEYEIVPCAVAPTVELTPTEYTYDGSKKTPKVTVTVNGTELTEGKDFKVEYSNNENAEDGAKATITAMGNYSFETVEKSFSISKANSVIDTAPAANNFTYDALSHELLIEGEVTGGRFEYKLGDGDWVRDIPKAKDAGEYTVWYRVIGDSNHNDIGEKSVKVTIEHKDIADADIVLGPSLTYNTKEQVQTVFHVKFERFNATYDIENNRATNAGTYKLKVIGTGNFKGEREVEFTIAKKEVTASVTVGGEYIYNGKDIEPTDITVKDGEDIIPDTEYTVSFGDNKDAGTAKVTITNAEGGNYIVNGTGEFEIEQANITVKPKDISKIYGSAPEFKLESDSDLITEKELAAFASSAKFKSDGAERTAKVIDGGYEITAELTENKTNNLILTLSGTGILTVVPKKLTIKVNDVSREYGAANPELSVSYSGFVNDEDESVLGGELKLSYDSNINEQTPVETYKDVTKAEGLTSGNYDITYVNGNVTITKIAVTASEGTTSTSYFCVVLDRAVEGLTTANFSISADGAAVALSNVTASRDNKTYLLSGRFKKGTEYTVTINLSGAAADATHEMVNSALAITLANTNSGSTSTRYTVTFETNGGSRIASRTVTKNSVMKEPAAPTKEGFDFAGWYSDKGLKTKYDFSEKVSKNLTLYAAWTEQDHSKNQIILTIGDTAAQVFGRTKNNDVAPKIVNDRTMLPARFVAENLGAKVKWDGEKGLVTITGKNMKTNEEVTILITIGAENAMVNGKEVKLDSPAFIENDRTYTPVRFISEELGASVEWFESEQKVVITK